MQNIKFIFSYDIASSKEKQWKIWVLNLIYNFLVFLGNLLLSVAGSDIFVFYRTEDVYFWMEELKSETY
jgi:hypothetical protein